MSAVEAADVLRDLLAEEASGGLARISAAQPFADWLDDADASLLEAMLAEEREALGRLARLTADAGGLLAQRRLDTRDARLHYLDLRYLLPLLVDDKRRRMHACQRAAALLSFQPAASTIISGIAAMHESHFAQLEEMSARVC